MAHRAKLESRVAERRLLLTAEETAELLGIGRSTVFKMIAADELPGVVRLGRSLRISRVALETWIQQRMVGAEL